MMKPLIFFAAVLALAQTTPTTIDSGTLAGKNLPAILNSNFTSLYNGAEPYVTTLPATCVVGEKKTIRWTGYADEVYHCIALNTWQLQRSLITINGIPAKGVIPATQRVDLATGDNAVFTCPTGKWCFYTGPGKATNDGSSAQYSTGTLSLTYGSSTVTGVGTNFTSGMSPARIHLTAANVDIYVTGFGSSTSLTLGGPWFGSTSSGLAYTLNYGSVTLGGYMIHNGTRYEMSTGANPVVPAGTTSDITCCLQNSIHIAPGDTIGYTSTAAGASIFASSQIMEPNRFVKDASNWNISGGVYTTIYTCPASTLCTFNRATSGSFSTPLSGTHITFYQGGPATAEYQMFVVRAGDAGPSPANWVYPAHGTLARGFSPVNTFFATLGPGDSLVGYFPDSTVTRGAIITTVTEIPLEP